MLADHCHPLLIQTVLNIGEQIFLDWLRCMGTMNDWLQSMIWSVIEEVSDRSRYTDLYIPEAKLAALCFRSEPMFSF